MVESLLAPVYSVSRVSDPTDRTQRSVRIRDGAPKDALAIAEFHTVCWREAYRGIVPQAYLDALDVPERKVRWEKRLATRAVAVGDLQGEIVGVASSGPAGDGTKPDVMLWTLYVAAEQRGTGLALALMERVLGAEPAQLWVFETNDRARAFYARSNFRDDGQRQIDPGTGVCELHMIRWPSA
jgi:GNAT superfamily N-acetyltransferase